MAESYRYAIVGASLAGASAVLGIRERDREGRILLIGDEVYHPYNRPPLTKQLWFGKKTVDQIYVRDATYYTEHGVDVRLRRTVTALDAAAMTLTDDQGQVYACERLLLATGGRPRHLSIPGGELAGIFYYRTLAHYEVLRHQVTTGSIVTVIGGGFIGSEIAAALQQVGARVTMIFPEAHLVSRVFPESLGRHLTEYYRQEGITVLQGDVPVSIEKQGAQFLTRTKNGREVLSDLLIAGAGITPETQLAQQAGLQTENGITVNEYLQSSHSAIYAAGDNANFPYQALHQRMRVEHWDNALNQGLYAGRNMAGAATQYDYMPYFFSDLFRFGYEAVGQVDTRLDVVADWQKTNDTGVIYYLRDGKVRGVMLCNVWGKVDAAREVIRRDEVVSPDRLRGMIPAQEQAA